MDTLKVLESPNGVVFNKGNRDQLEKMAAKIREMTAAAHGAGTAVNPQSPPPAPAPSIPEQIRSLSDGESGRHRTRRVNGALNTHACRRSSCHLSTRGVGWREECAQIIRSHVPETAGIRPLEIVVNGGYGRMA